MTQTTTRRPRGLFALIFWVALIFTGSMLFTHNTGMIRDGIKDLLQFDAIPTTIALFILAVNITESIFINGFVHNVGIWDIRKTTAEIVSAVSEPGAFISSYAVLKGLYLDQFFQDNYFARFSEADRMFLWASTSAFFLWSMLETGRSIKKLYDHFNR